MKASQTLHLGLATLCLLFVGRLSALAADPVAVDLAGYSPASGIEVHRDRDHLQVRWLMEGGEAGEMEFSLRERPLIKRLGLSRGGKETTILSDADPGFWMTIGTRESPPGRPAEMSIWNTFFDNPAKRPHQTHRSQFELRRVKVTSEGKHATVSFGDISIGPFSGEVHFTFYPGSRLIQVEAVVSTPQDKVAFIYDAGLFSEAVSGLRLAWMDTDGRMQRAEIENKPAGRSLAVRHRAIILEGGGASLACFPAPHEFFFPVDYTTNNKFVWFGQGHQGDGTPFCFGIRQDPTGGGNYVPWFNGPPGTKQRLGFFLLLAGGDADHALKETLRFTRGDRFTSLPGHVTFTSHYHMAIAVAAMAQVAKGQPLGEPDFVRMFKQMGVGAVHLAEFHGDGHPRDPGPLRLPEMDGMFTECRRLSDDELLLIPGEEGNDFLGIKEPGKHPGHWMSLFPKEVYWVMQRKEGDPLKETDPKRGTIYRVGSREDMFELLKRERGLAWSAHPRIKASNWTPDIFRKADFYLSERWLGGAWKAMPADLSRERLGERCLDLLSDMANWGQRKYLPGEVDVFKLDHTHELYGHMNINYLRLARLPRYEDGWQPVLDALRAGAFFTTTGEVLIREFSVGGKQSGETLIGSAKSDAELRVKLEWTFPLRFAEAISGDGSKVYRQRIDMADTEAFGSRTLTWKPELRGRKWVRFEVWDVACNGAYTQPVWLE